MNVFASTLKYHSIYLLDGFGAEDIPVFPEWKQNDLMENFLTIST